MKLISLKELKVNSKNIKNNIFYLDGTEYEFIYKIGDWLQVKNIKTNEEKRIYDDELKYFFWQKPRIKSEDEYQYLEKDNEQLKELLRKALSYGYLKICKKCKNPYKEGYLCFECGNDNSEVLNG